MHEITAQVLKDVFLIKGRDKGVHLNIVLSKTQYIISLALKVTKVEDKSYTIGQHSKTPSNPYESPKMS